ncbi:ABC-type cobalt transport system substrate-binding protein [Kroppenstedtia sanguinis]
MDTVVDSQNHGELNGERPPFFCCLVPLQATLILFFKAEAGWWSGSDLLQRAQRRIKSHHPYLSVIFHTMFAEEALDPSV